MFRRRFRQVQPVTISQNFTIDRRAIPPGAVESRWMLADGQGIRRIDWHVQEPLQCGSLLFMPGRSDFYEKYIEALHHWHRRGWNVTSADWRGQAGSGRLGADPLTGHVDDFGIWAEDLEKLWAEWRASTPGPHVMVAHSMGGHIVLRALAEGRIDPDASVLVAPMLGLMPNFGVVPISWLHGAMRFMASRGDPRRPAWKGTERPGWAPIDRMSRLTHDKPRYDDETWWRTERPELVMGAPSWGWIEAAYRSVRLLCTKGFLEGISGPVLMIATRADRLVDFDAIAKAAARIENCRLEAFGREARHELLREEDSVRDKILRLIDDFLDSAAGGEA